MAEYRFPGFFELVDGIVDAMEHGDYEVAFPQDEPDLMLLETAKIVHRASLPDEDTRIMNVPSVLATALLPQMSRDEYLQLKNPDPALGLSFSSTRHKGRGCVFYRWPDDRPIDFKAMRTEIEKIKDMCREATPEQSASLPRTYRDQIAIGPIDVEDHRMFEHLLNRLCSHEYISIGYEFELQKDGTFFGVFDRRSYLELFKHEAEFSPERKAAAPFESKPGSEPG